MACGAKALSIDCIVFAIDHLDKDGTKTKAHVEQLINRWKAATKMMGAGWGARHGGLKTMVNG